MRFWEKQYTEWCKVTFFDDTLLREDNVILHIKEDIYRVCCECNKQKICVANLERVKRVGIIALMKILNQENYK